MAVGFSADEEMGEDYVVYCTSSLDAAAPGSAGIGYNPGGLPSSLPPSGKDGDSWAGKLSTVLLEPTGFLHGFSAGTTDGVSHCTLTLSTDVPPLRELAGLGGSLNASLQLLLAAGAASSPEPLTYHSFRATSPGLINVAAFPGRPSPSPAVTRGSTPPVPVIRLVDLIANRNSSSAFLTDLWRPLSTPEPQSPTLAYGSQHQVRGRERWVVRLRAEERGPDRVGALEKALDEPAPFAPEFPSIIDAPTFPLTGVHSTSLHPMHTPQLAPWTGARMG